jgi:hypothetical protein
VDGGVLADRVFERMSRKGCLRGARSDETSAVDVSGQHYGHERGFGHASGQSGTSSNVVTSRFKISMSKLESLILAQSERWRQA